MRRSMVVAAFVLGFLSFLLVLAHGSKVRREYAQKYGTPTSVLVVTRDVLEGETLERRDFKKEEIPASFIQPGAVQNADDLMGRIVINPMRNGEQVLATKLYTGEGGHLAYNISTGDDRRAITLRVKTQGALVRLLWPGDIVDVVGVFESESGSEKRQRNHASVICEARKVLAVDARLSRESAFTQDKNQSGSGSAGDACYVTLEVTPEEARRLSLAEAVGTLRCILRHPTDSKPYAYDGPWVRTDDKWIGAEGKVIVPDKKWMETEDAFEKQ